jgi:hypothetical protein
MKRLVLSSIIISLFSSNLWAYPWPIKPFEEVHRVDATLGDFRGSQTSPRFHRGIDIPACNGTDVFSIRTGEVTVRSEGTNVETVQVGWPDEVKHFFYVHVDAEVSTYDTAWGIVDTLTPTHIADIKDLSPSGCSKDHLHFQIGDTTNRSGFLNPLSYDIDTTDADTTTGPNGFTDTLKPIIKQRIVGSDTFPIIDFFPQGSDTLDSLPAPLDTLYSYIDIRVRAQDKNNSGGDTNTSGIYELEYYIYWSKWWGPFSLDSFDYYIPTSVISSLLNRILPKILH